MRKETGGPAFPLAHVFKEQAVFCDGMTIRDYFAAKALNGLLSNPGTYQINDEKVFARDAYLLADAMLEARKK